ncbi:MAG TPA: restriction endonuclease subunit S [Chthoniobacterales bacterium]|nr:restriction endonuclease subunit S [Chthoniobacterales bacterium]
MSAILGWTPKKLRELAEYINGYAFKPDDWGKEGLPIIRIEQLKNPDAPADYFNGKFPPSKVIDDGDLIFSWSASLFLRIWCHGRAALNQHLFKVIEREGVDRKFLKAFIEFNLPALTAASHGSTMQHITRKELARFQSPFPDSEREQATIAEVLATVDRALEVTITVERDRSIVVHAPQGLSEEELRRAVDAKRQWILAKLRHPQKYQDRLHPPGKEVINGESAPYLGRDLRA